jgi:hypothetical protein
MTTVAALAGRRIDAANALVVRFPPDHVQAVEAALTTLLQRENVDLLVCSAASGADLLGLKAATKLGAKFRIVLPYDPALFRQTSVTDRPGDWAPLYDRFVERARAGGNLIVLGEEVGSKKAYSHATEAIIREAQIASVSAPAFAITVWEGKPRKLNDATAQFRELALKAGMLERVVSTC